MAATSDSSTDYLYNVLGQMYEKSGTAGTTIFMQDEAGHMIGEYSGSGGLIEETIWLADIPVATVRPTPCGLGIFYIHTDHLNRPRLISRRTTSDVVWRWDTDPFGTAAPNQNPSGLGTFSYNLRFPGQYYQAETGLNQNYNRDYDPLVGRYVESDPIGLTGGINTYAYVSDDPSKLSDPSGLCNIKLRCGPVLRGGVQVGWHCGVVAPNGIEFGLGGGNSSGISGTASPYPHAGDPLTPGVIGPTQVEYPVTCACQSCDGVQKCVQSYHDTETPPSYFFSGPNSNTYAHHMVDHCNCSLGNGLAKPPGATGWNFDFPDPLPYQNVVPAL
ncbi:MAG TPA: RHS repeat-associated core domain-containing protein [Steroidobacteraceae bacterium]|jgi:RHS repeat-associated protein|nr:RHS repeat-associated core domain-containing protein [Steroidobacteraceae bacterium]